MWVQDGSSDVEVGLIYGLAGIGKTTIAQLVFNQNTQKFDGACFLADFTRKTTQGDGLTCFLEQIILDITGKPGNKIYDVAKGLMAVRAIVCSRKVLVVLDDVDERKQLPAAFEDDPGFFGKGSKIIITTKNQELGKVSILKQKFKVGEVGYKESMEILKLHSLVNRNPSSQIQEVLLEGFLRHCHGLPLAHILMGHILRAETQETWEDLLQEMDRYPNKDVQNVFRMSYEAVGDNDAKELFLFVACFFIGVHKKHAAIILESCGLRAISGLQKLINRCLVIVDYDNRLSMHKSIEKMGKEIVDQEAVDKRSKLWNSKDSLSLLLNDKGTPSIRGLHLNLSDLNRHTSPACSKPSAKCSGLSSITTSAFKNMPNIEILLLSKVQLVEKSFVDFPERIKWLEWERFPLESISLNLNLDEVVVLDMQKSCLIHAWKGSKDLWALRILYLSHSVHLVTSPDLSSAPLLELISFEGCKSLVDVHESAGNLERLEQLNMKGCISLVTIHGSFKKTNKLTILNLNGCKSLINLSIPMLSSIERLDISECSSLHTISRYERSMTQYQVRCASPCWPLKVSLPSLTELNISKLGISRADIFDLIKCAPLLETLDLSCNPIRVLHSVDKDACLRLKSLRVLECTDLQSISNIPECCEVAADDCISLERITYAYNGLRAMALPMTYTNGCGKLVEVNCGSSDVLSIERQGEMDEYQAKYLGFPTMTIFKQISWGVYRGGIYNVWLDGDLLLSKWFTTTTDGPELLYTVPSSIPDQPRIRALNLGVSCTTHRGSPKSEKMNLLITAVEVIGHQWGAKIENLSNKWEWSFLIPDLRGFWKIGDGIITWLSHCCVMEHREIRPGDLLKISVWDQFAMRKRTLRMGIKIIYEEQTEGVKQESSSSKSLIKVGEVDNEEAVASVAAVVCQFSRGPPYKYFQPSILASDCLSYYKYDGSVAAIACLFSRAIPVRALDFGYVGTSEGFSRLNSDSLLSRVWEVKIENRERRDMRLQNWTLKVPYRPTGNVNGEAMTMTALHHLCRMEGKYIISHDVLKISVCDPADPQLKLGIKVICEVSEDKEDAIEEEVSSVPADVASWYDKTLRPPHLDLSFFEIKKDSNEYDADDDEKVKKYYRIGNTYNSRWNNEERLARNLMLAVESENFQNFENQNWILGM